MRLVADGKQSEKSAALVAAMKPGPSLAAVSGGEGAITRTGNRIALRQHRRDRAGTRAGVSRPPIDRNTPSTSAYAMRAAGRR
jgi:hypothetical protein